MSVFRRSAFVGLFLALFSVVLSGCKESPPNSTNALSVKHSKVRVG